MITSSIALLSKATFAHTWHNNKIPETELRLALTTTSEIYKLDGSTKPHTDKIEGEGVQTKNKE